MPADADRAETYWEEVATSRWGSYVTDREHEHLLAALEQARPGVALEVGCEGGRWSKLVHDRGWQVVCTDVDATSLALCKRRIPDAECILVDPEDTRLPAESGRVRLVLVYEVAPVIDAPWFLGEAARVLEPGGLLVCSTWNSRSLRGAAYRVLARLDRQERDGARRFQTYYRGPSYHAFRKSLGAHGFEVVRERGLCWFPFKRDSDSPLVGPATALETALGLSRLPSLSPWVLTIAMRRPGAP
jgi:SAM-dependent methyltransferase